MNNAITGAAEWNILGWTRAFTKHFQLTNSKEDEVEFNEFKDNVLNVGILYFAKIKD